MVFSPNVLVAYTHNVSDGGIRVHKLPKPGETVRALDCGNGIDAAKGTNVVVAASRVGACVALIAHVPKGDWFFRAKEILETEKIDDRFVVRDDNLQKHAGCILIDDEGNNMIVLGSNSRQSITVQEADCALESYAQALYCITGYELDPESAEYIVQKAHQLGIQTVFNPSPVPETIPTFWDAVDILILNEVETLHMLRLANLSPAQDWEENARALRQAYGCSSVVITLGSEGFCSLDRNNVSVRGAGIQTAAFDTTGAGDGFLGAMVARLAAGDELGKACAKANLFAAYSVQNSGTISSYPSTEEWAEILSADSLPQKKV